MSNNMIPYKYCMCLSICKTRTKKHFNLGTIRHECSILDNYVVCDKIILADRYEKVCRFLGTQKYG